MKGGFHHGNHTVYVPTGFGIIKSYELVSGTCPEQYNEIVIDKNVQLELEYQLNIGDTITLPTAGSKTEDFIITGFTDNVETGTFYFYVSPAYAEQGVSFLKIQCLCEGKDSRQTKIGPRIFRCKVLFFYVVAKLFCLFLE